MKEKFSMTDKVYIKKIKKVQINEEKFDKVQQQKKNQKKD